MNIPTPDRKFILLVTDKDETKELVNVVFESLKARTESYPQMARFAAAELEPCPSVDDTLSRLQASPREGLPDPVLVIVDALVRRQCNTPTPGNGTAANDLLSWLGASKPEVPVLVVSPASIEQLDLKVFARRNVALWGLGPISSSDPVTSLAQILSGLGSPSASWQRRITVDIGTRSARYRIKDGHYEFTTDAKAYADSAAFPFLAKKTDRYSPYDENGHPRKDWQTTLVEDGQLLFDKLLRDTLGVAMLQSGDDTLDLRFDIDLTAPESERLYPLPLEIVTHDWLPDNFLCTRIPMARRVCLRTPAGASPAKSDPAEGLRVLFLNASFGGTVSLTHEITGERLPAEELTNIKFAESELDALKKIQMKKAGRPIGDVKVIDGKEFTGQDLLDKVRDSLKEGRYDVFHFSGHSISLQDNGGTFLVFPGEEGRGLPVSIRAVAQWLQEGGCRLVVLSSCRGASLRTAVQTMRAGAEAVLGFRWDVNDERATDYFSLFYEAYLTKGRPLSEAYRDACKALQGLYMGSPVWASAVAVVSD